jgi:uncharacterized delta-60 repeat protein
MLGPERRRRRAGTGWLGIMGVLVVSAMVPAAALAGAGSPDPSFGSGGIVKYELGFGNYSPFSRLRAIAPAPGGKLDFAGVTGDGEGDFEVLAGRLNEDGTLDPSFGSGGSVRSLPVEDPNLRDESAETEAVQSDGGLVVAGNVIERFTDAGQFDSSFAPNSPPFQISDLSGLGEGKLLAVGSEDNGEQFYAAEVERLLSDGHPDPSFGSGGILKLPLHSGEHSRMSAHGALILADGDVLVSGSGFYVTSGSEPGHAFLWAARLTPAGALDSAFGTGGLAYIYEAEGPRLIEPDGSGLALLGRSNTSAGFRMAAWGLTTDGAVNPAFGSNGVSVIPTIPGYNECALAAATVDEAGRLLLTCTERDDSPTGTLQPVPSIARLTPEGELDPSFGEGGQTLGPQNSDFDALAIDSQGRIVAAGTEGEPLSTGSGREYSLVERFLSEEASPPASTPSGAASPSSAGTSSSEAPGASGARSDTSASAASPPAAGAKAACITAPVRIGRLALPNGHTISVSVGELVYVELVVPEKYSSPFPWLTPASSNSHVLKRVPLCATTKLRPSTLSLGISAFRALRAGTASITAPLAPAWRARKPSRRRGLRAYHAVVHIR